MNANDVDLALCDTDARRRMGMAAGDAFKAQCAADPTFLPEMKAETGLSASKLAADWRHRMVKLWTNGRAARLSEVTRRDFNDVLGGFANLAGKPAEAYLHYSRSGPAAGRAGEDGASQEAVRNWLAKCYAEGPGYGFNRFWMRGYARRVFKKASAEECTPEQLRSIYITMRSRWLKKQRQTETPDPS